MTIIAVVFAALASLLHVYIWVLESFRWTEPATRKTFGTSESEAAITAPLAYNQGFYNLFLAVVTVVGLLVLGRDHAVGSALALAGTGSMLAAAIVLVTHDRTMARAALTQGLFPLFAVAWLLVQL